MDGPDSLWPPSSPSPSPLKLCSAAIAFPRVSIINWDFRVYHAIIVVETLSTALKISVSISMQWRSGEIKDITYDFSAHQVRRPRHQFPANRTAARKFLFGRLFWFLYGVLQSRVVQTLECRVHELLVNNVSRIQDEDVFAKLLGSSRLRDDPRRFPFYECQECPREELFRGEVLSHDEGIPHLDIFLLLGLDVDKVLERIAVPLYEPFIVGKIRPDLGTGFKADFTQGVEEWLLRVGNE